MCACVCVPEQEVSGLSLSQHFAPVTAIVPGQQHRLQPWQGIYFISYDFFFFQTFLQKHTSCELNISGAAQACSS